MAQDEIESDRPVQTRDPLIGRMIAGKFLIERLVGSGAYEAKHEALSRRVAIKVLHGHLMTDENLARRFHREAKAASRLNHPNSITIIDFGQEPDGVLYIAMEYLDGKSLDQLLASQFPLPGPRIHVPGTGRRQAARRALRPPLPGSDPLRGRDGTCPKP